MPLNDIIATVADMLAAVEGVGPNVHARIRWGADEAKFKELFQDDGKILGWTVTREATTATDLVGVTIDKHAIVIRGYLSLSDADATETTFQDLVETIRDAFNQNRRLRVAGISKAAFTSRVSVRTVEHRMFGGYLCHYAELVLLADDFVKP